ncbi:response regulator [Poriferisphaera sp. WC338]|uniref:response regulator n=1 Tax=Poriferisphaera sp. WC338 TaxID=3425129 RepID=UPI003D81ABCB
MKGRLMIKQSTILVVDDETHILHVVSLKLRNAGYEIITAEDGEEGLAKALSHKPDLIITDYQMPFMTGLELCIKLKEHDETAGTPALMLTARGLSLESEYFEQTNIAGVLTKPFSPREILMRVEELLSPQTTTNEVKKAS